MAPVTFLDSANFVIETAIMLTAFLLFSVKLTPRLRILLYRCAFIIALAAPLAFFVSAPKDALISVAAIDIAPFQAVSGSTNAAADFLTRNLNFYMLDLIVLIWFFGALSVLARSVISNVLLSRAFADGLPPSAEQEATLRAFCVELGVDAPVRMRFSKRPHGACAFGWLRPKILIPASFRKDTLDAVIAHELCHVRARDALWITIVRLACALYWFNPLIWTLARRHHEDIELLCDDFATQRVITIDAYARALVNVARHMTQPLQGAGAMMSQRGFATRIRQLTHRRRPLPVPGLLGKISAITVSAAVLSAMNIGQVVSAREPHSMTFNSQQAAPGHGLIFVQAPHGVLIEVGATGSCSDGGSCVFEHPLGVELSLRARSERPKKIEWIGCAPDPATNICQVRIGKTPIYVKARLQDR